MSSWSGTKARQVQIDGFAPQRGGANYQYQFQTANVLLMHPVGKSSHVPGGSGTAICARGLP